MELDRIVFKGAKEICGAVGVNWREISYFVVKKGLPAFKIDGKGSWIARPDDLERWIQKQRDENLQNPV
ncbi:hypothetical protein [uncultured Desulfobacter sp.]|uniref:hypothetical protein n=1 Tax=uncultured Desulfobacter sp. TaxID=240139 RepID=UPI0029C7C905|nr:hypothetical protein [uncultured Desulfobacter sp.]